MVITKEVSASRNTTQDRKQTGRALPVLATVLSVFVVFLEVPTCFVTRSGCASLKLLVMVGGATSKERNLQSEIVFREVTGVQ